MSVTRTDENFVAGSFSGVLGFWDPGHDTGNVPPDHVVNLTNGVFKHAKGVVVSEVGKPGHQLTSFAERKSVRLSPGDYGKR